MCESFIVTKSLKCLSFTDTQCIVGSALKAICYLVKTTNLKELVLSNCDINDGEGSCIIFAAGKSKSLKQLCMADNCLGVRFGRNLAWVIQKKIQS